MLSVIIPCFNEEEIIAKNTNKILNWSKNQDFETEILVVNNNSTDKTLEEINKFEDYEDVVRGHEPCRTLVSTLASASFGEAHGASTEASP